MHVVRDPVGSYVFRITDEDRCGKCRVCITSCPGGEVDFIGLNQAHFGEAADVDPLVGHVHRSYIAYALDDDIRARSSSGGTVTALLVYALEKGLIDGAVAVRNRPGDILNPEPFIARTRADLLSTQQSKYVVIPANQALAEILKTEGRFATVGLPCQVEGLRKAQRINRFLRRKIAFTIGLFCGINLSFDSVRFLLDRLGIDDVSAVKDVRYREARWWGGEIVVELKDGTARRLPASEKNWINYIYALPRCTFCPDHTAELADIAVGDAWIAELKGLPRGHSVVLTRTADADDLVQQARRDGVLWLEELPLEKAIESQRPMLAFKKRGITARERIWRALGRTPPLYRSVPPPPRANWMDYLAGLQMLFFFETLKSRQLRRIFNRLPSGVLRPLALFHTNLATNFDIGLRLRRKAWQYVRRTASRVGLPTL